MLKAAVLTLWISGQFFDGVSTIYALNHGFQEGNPALGNHQAVILSIKGTGNLVAFAAYKNVSNKKAKIIIPIVMAGAGITAGTINLHRIRNRR